MEPCLLAMAQDRLTQKYHSDVNHWEMTLKRDRDGNIVEENVSRPSFPTDQDIFDLAAKLKNFVENK